MKLRILDIIIAIIMTLLLIYLIKILYFGG